MEELWFDARFIHTQTGEPLSAESAQAQLAAGSQTIKFLGDMLLAEEFDYTQTSFSGPDIEARRQAMRSWGPDECYAFGSWVLGLIGSEDESQSIITQRIIRRLDMLHLGLGDRELIHQSEAGSLAEYRRQLGTPVGKTWGRYAHWGVREYVRYARRVERRAGGKPGWKDYDAASSRGEGPGRYGISTSIVGSVDKLNELIWYPNVEAMDADDAVFWGVRVRRANEGKPVTVTMVRILSARRRGPNQNRIYDLFSNWGDFSTRVNEAYEYEMEDAEQERKRKIGLYSDMIARGELPPEASGLDDENLIAVGGRFLVAQHFARDLSPQEQWAIALQPSNKSKAELRSHRHKLTAGWMELWADENRVHDDIWPLDEGLEHLVVSEDEIEAVLREKRAKRRK